MDINQKLTEELEVKSWQVDAAVKLIDEGNTIPFISRYRKEATGSLNDEQLRKLHERLAVFEKSGREKRAGTFQHRGTGKTDRGTEKLRSWRQRTLVVVEDLYRPYRPKRRTGQQSQKKKDWSLLAAVIILQKLKSRRLEEAENYVSEEKGVASAEDALAGAKDIHGGDRSPMRQTTEAENPEDDRSRKERLISTAKDEKQESVYEMYYEFEEPVSKLAGHRILALNRGEKEKILTVQNGGAGGRDSPLSGKTDYSRG